MHVVSFFLPKGSTIMIGFEDGDTVEVIRRKARSCTGLRFHELAWTSRHRCISGICRNDDPILSTVDYFLTFPLDLRRHPTRPVDYNNTYDVIPGVMDNIMQCRMIKEVPVRVEGFQHIWRVTLTGPADTPFAGGIFHVLFVPSPPQLSFLTPILHPNISPKTGIIYAMHVHYESDFAPMPDLFQALMLRLQFPDLHNTAPDSDAQDWSWTRQEKARNYTADHATSWLYTQEINQSNPITALSPAVFKLLSPALKVVLITLAILYRRPQQQATTHLVSGKKQKAGINGFHTLPTPVFWYLIRWLIPAANILHF